MDNASSGTTGSKFDDCQQDIIPKRCVWFLQSWRCPLPYEICFPVRQDYPRRDPLSYVITGNYCPPADSTVGDATGDDPSADPSDN